MKHAAITLTVLATAAHLQADTAMVAAADPLAVQAGVEVLKQGGNAMDAATAIAFSLGVVEPYACGVGGGGYLVSYRAKDQAILTVDFREVAPAALQPKHYQKNGVTTQSTLKEGGIAVAVPGMVRGVHMAHAQHGKLPFGKLLEPAIKQATDGYPLSKYLHGIMDDNLDVLSSQPATAAMFLDESGLPKDDGAILKYPDLAATLKSISEKGPEAIYNPAMAGKIADAVKAAGGIMTADDVLAYKALERKPISAKYRDYEIVTVGPSSMGGIALLQMLRLLEAYPLGQHDPLSAEYIALIVAAQEQAYAAVAAKVADPATATVPVDELLSDAWVAEARKKLPFTPEDFAQKAPKATPGAAPAAAPSTPPDPKGAKEHPGNTTSFVVRDAEGNMVSLTQTIDTFFGSGVTVPGAGILLNNEMYDFTAEDGSINIPAPGKRPRSNITPILILKNGKPVAALGTPGGQRIPSSLAQILFNRIDQKLSLQDAINAPRIWHDSGKGRVAYEKRIPAETMKKVATLLGAPQKYKPDSKGAMDKFFGGAQALWLETGADGKANVIGAADPRRNGVAQGF